MSLSNDELLNVLDWLRWVSSELRRACVFFGHGTDNDWDEAVVLLLWAIDQPWSRLESLFSARLSGEEKARLRAALEQRVSRRVPAAYITGEAWFAGERYIVNENVLVPRSPIAELISREFQPWLEVYPERILDLCTGSGCIGIACAKAFPESEVDLADISEAALDVAAQNIALHDLAERVFPLLGDGLAAVADRRYQLIVCNPPYVSEAEYAGLPPEYKAEPKLGLTSGEDGFDFVRNLLAQAAEHLLPQGVLVVEVGYGWALFQDQFPQFAFFWPEFEHGGGGVFVLTREQLLDAPSVLLNK